MVAAWLDYLACWCCLSLASMLMLMSALRLPLMLTLTSALTLILTSVPVCLLHWPSHAPLSLAHGMASCVCREAEETTARGASPMASYIAYRPVCLVASPVPSPVLSHDSSPVALIPVGSHISTFALPVSSRLWTASTHPQSQLHLRTPCVQ